MGSSKQNKQLAKLIVYMLGRCPGECGLITDPDGFVKIKEFLKALNEEAVGRHANPSLLNELMLTMPDVPFEISNDRIRARDRLEPVVRRRIISPLPNYFTCIRRKALPHVIENGLSPSHHDHIILSPTSELAEKIGKRRDEAPAVLTILTEKAQNRGIDFFPADPPLVTADFIPPDCFIAPSLPKEKPSAGKPSPKPGPKPTSEKERVIDNQAGSFSMRINDGKPVGGKKTPSWKKERRKTRQNKHRGWPDTDE